MSAAKKPAHTPGPWTAGDYDRPVPPWEGFVGVFAPSFHPADSSQIRIVAACGDANGALRSQSEADAHLIAAAPDLLEACKGLLDGPENTLAQRIAFARDTIRKAEAGHGD